MTGRLLAIASFALVLGLSTGPALAQTALPLAPSPSPSASAAPSGASDPCGALITIVNRPTVTTAVCTVRTGHVDLEDGYTNTVTTGPGGGNTAVYPQSYLRIGTWDPHLEFNMTAPTVTKSSVGGPAVTGSSDISVGIKDELGYGPRWLYGANTAVTIPTGTRAFSAGNAQYTGNFNCSYTINSAIALSSTMGFNALSGYNASGTPQSYFAFIPSLEATATIPDGSEFFAEYAYFSASGPNLGGRSLYDFGYVRDFGQHVQFDGEYGFSPTPIGGQRQHYVGAGLSFMY